MGCRAITPALVGLASRLEGKPFHLIASFCQRGKREDAVAYIRGKGLAADTPNLTVTYQGRHPQVKGNGYVPYYMVFDHTGRMVHHHMCGNYHGGDGLAMIEWVDRLLEKTPALWLGAQPFETHAALAERVAGGNALAKWVAEAESLQAAEPHAELDRILAGVTRYRDRGLQRAESLLAASPKDVLPLLEELADELGETETCKPVRERLASLEAGDVLDRSIAIAKQLDKQRRRLEKAKPCKSCKRSGAAAHVAGCATCGEQNRRTLASMQKKLEALLEESEGLPIRRAVESVLAASR